MDIEVQGEEVFLGKSGLLFVFPKCRYNFLLLGFIPLSLEKVTSTWNDRTSGTNVLNDHYKDIWHSKKEKVPYIVLKMEEEEEVFMVKVVDRKIHCCKRYKDVEVRVSSTLSYNGAVSCGIKSGDSWEKLFHK